MRPLKNRCCPNREIQFASIATVEAALASRDATLTRAGWAGDSIWPEARLKVKPCCLLVRKHCEQLNGRDCALAHELIVDNYLEGVKYYLAVLHIYFQTFRVIFPNPACKPMQDGYVTPLERQPEDSWMFHWSIYVKSSKKALISSAIYHCVVLRVQNCQTWL